MSCTWTSYVLHTDFLCIAYILPMSCIWTSCVLHMGFLYAAYGLPMCCTWTSYVLHTDFLCSAYGLPISCIWTSYVLHMGFLCPAYGLVMCCIWTSCVQHMDFLVSYKMTGLLFNLTVIEYPSNESKVSDANRKYFCDEILNKPCVECPHFKSSGINSVSMRKSIRARSHLM